MALDSTRFQARVMQMVLPTSSKENWLKFLFQKDGDKTKALATKMGSLTTIIFCKLANQ